MDRIFLGKIHKIIAGTNPGDKSSMGYTVGFRATDKPTLIVSSIEPENIDGQDCYVVWVYDTADKEQKAFPFKTFINVPVTLSSDLESSKLN